jgi:hypothetical protein
LSFCDAGEAEYLRDIEKLTGTALSVAGGRPAPVRSGGGRPGSRPAQQQKRPQRQRRRQRPQAERRVSA